MEEIKRPYGEYSSYPKAVAHLLKKSMQGFSQPQCAPRFGWRLVSYQRQGRNRWRVMGLWSLWHLRELRQLVSSNHRSKAMDHDKYLAIRAGQRELESLAHRNKPPRSALGLALWAAARKAAGLAVEAVQTEAKAVKASDTEIRRMLAAAEKQGRRSMARERQAILAWQGAKVRRAR